MDFFKFQKKIKAQRADNVEITLPLTILISFFLHMLIFIGLILPNLQNIFDTQKKLKDRLLSGRDIIVNINQDNKRKLDNKTLLSDKDSTAKGFISRNRGDRWLNNSLDFKLKGNNGSTSGIKGKQTEVDKNKIFTSNNSELLVTMQRKKQENNSGEGGFFPKDLIPDKNGVNRRNALFYSTSGAFSFNTAKFKNFLYFKAMKDKIASYWYPPIMANAMFGGYDPMTGSYTPGRTRIMAIPSQEVKLYFVMNRKGDVVDIQILDSYGNESLDSSCLDSIRFSKNFGKVPDDIKGEFIVIPFIFGYYVQ